MTNNILINSWWISSELILKEAKQMALNSQVLSRENNLFLVNSDKENIIFKSVDCWLNSSFWLKIANNKELTYLLAEKNNIRVPVSKYLSREDYLANNYTNLNIDYPVISKPIDWAHWDWVSINLKDIDELKEWLKYTFESEDVTKAVIQEQIFWEDHRIIVVNWKVEAVTKRIAPYIIGDWISSVKSLIETENKNPLRWWGEDHDAQMSQIKIDSESISYIEEQWYKMDFILEKDKKINVRQNENLSTWWIAIDMTDEIPNEVKDEAIKIAKLVWLWFCGVDFFCKDISLPLKEGKWAIIEINATPWIRMHHFPSQWKSRNVAKKILEAIF